LIAAALDHWQATRQITSTPRAQGGRDAANPWKLAGRVDLMRRRG
jgi:hypothetical protein